MSAPDPNLTVTLSLVSHTNVGKTTLARTLLKRDIGEVRDAETRAGLDVEAIDGEAGLGDGERSA